MSRRTAIILASILLFIPVSARAQRTAATITGTVVDASGAVIPSVTLTLENLRTGVVATNVSNETGNYFFTSVQPGLYKLTAELPGFNKYVLNEITVDVAARMGINIPMEVAGAVGAVEVTARPESPLFINSPSVGGVINGQRLLELPLPSRDALGLVLTQPGLLGDNFGGARIGALNVTRDGINVMDQRINSGVNSVVFTSVDTVEEVRVVTSPVDAELGRGSGQVQMSTRSGTNTIHGSVYETHRNTVLNANDFFNNMFGIERDALIRNSYGGRLGGPIKKDKTFFLVVYEGDRLRTAETVVATVFTQPARDGVFRFFPGVQNQNADGAAPTVDVLGNPVKPSATAQLQSVSLYGRDPLRNGPDPTGVVRKLLDVMPLPNDFRAGDGLNTAGYRWRRKAAANYGQINAKVDHYINKLHKASFTLTREKLRFRNGFLPQTFPNSPGGEVTSPAMVYQAELSSTFSPRLVNDFYVGGQRARVRFTAPWELPGGKSLMPAANGYGYLPVFSMVSDPIPTDNDPQGRITPLYAYGDKLQWFKGKHALKIGGEIRFVSTNGFNAFDVVPRVFFGFGDGPDLVGVNAQGIPGLGQNEGNAQYMLGDLAGAVDSITQAFNASGGTKPAFLAGESKQRTWRQREFSLYAQDDFKLKPRLTLNLGLRYEFYGVPWDANGRTAGLVGGSNGLFGISGNSWSDLYNPGTSNGQLTQVQLIGKRSPNPNTNLYNNDWNNLGPVVGLSWSMPYFGKDKTVLRAGYSVSYEREALRLVDIVAGDQPGLRSETTFTAFSALNLTQIRLPLTPPGQPLAVVPLEDRSQAVRSFDNNLRTPYIQNWNLTIQRELPGGFTLDVRYVGGKATKLWRAININEVNIFENGILEAFRITQQGGNAPLFDRLFSGFNLGLGTINGRTVTGSASLRQFATTRAYLANNSVGAFADFVNRASVQGERGAIPRFALLPENWITVNPQFAAAQYIGNLSNSTYNSMQLNAQKRLSSGWDFQTNYTWSRSLGDEEGDSQDLLNSFRNGRNRRIDKRLLGFHRTHIFRNSGTWELPIGPGKTILPNMPRFLGKVAGGWQFGGIVNVFSGPPISFDSGVTSFNQFVDNTATLVGPLARDAGGVKKTANGVVYFDGFTQVNDPDIATLTSAQLLNTRSAMKAIADSSGRVVAVNPTPGTLGSLSQTYLEGPGAFRFDVNLIKKFKFHESREVQMRVDIQNLLNKAQFADPVTDINSTSFGRLRASGGNRVIAIQARISF